MNFVFQNRKQSQHHGSENICAKATQCVVLKKQTNKPNKTKPKQTTTKRTQNKAKQEEKSKPRNRNQRTFPRGDPFEILFLEGLTHTF